MDTESNVYVLLLEFCGSPFGPGNLAPEQFFEDILYGTDEFSYMTDDAETLLNQLNGSQYSSGISPAILSFSDRDQLFMVVKYVYPDSPAQQAGLKRGDIILSVNGQSLRSSIIRNTSN